MSNKKDVACFTIRFNQENPRHNKAMQILNKHGKGMACLIADALCMYIHYGADFAGDLMKTTCPAMHPTEVLQNDSRNKFNSALDSFF